MAKKSNAANWAQKAKVKMKILMPVGATLSPSETIVLSEMYEQDVKILRDNSREVSTALNATETGLRVSQTLDAATKARSQAVGTFKITKDPIKKREWARRIVVADTTIQSVRDAKKRLNATKDRLTMIKGDMELQLIEAQTKAAEMEAYAKAGNSLRLAGEKLIHARSRADKLTLEYDNLEVTMEGAETMMSNLEPKALLAKAKQIIDRGNEVDEES